MFLWGQVVKATQLLVSFYLQNITNTISNNLLAWYGRSESKNVKKKKKKKKENKLLEK